MKRIPAVLLPAFILAAAINSCTWERGRMWPTGFNAQKKRIKKPT
jgi:hypothetical protein